MPEVNVNYSAVLVCGIISMVLGALWYGPLFSKKWIAYMDFTPEQIETGKKKGMTTSYLVNFIGALVMAYVLSHIIDFAQAETVSRGLQTGFWVWLGFVATVSLGSVLWEGRPTGLYILNNAYQLLALLINGAILAVWT